MCMHYAVVIFLQTFLMEKQHLMVNKQYQYIKYAPFKTQRV